MLDDARSGQRVGFVLLTDCMFLLAELAERWCSEHRGIPSKGDHLARFREHRECELIAALTDWQKTDDGSYASIAGFVERVVLTAALDDPPDVIPLQTFRFVLATHDLVMSADGLQAAIGYLVKLAWNSPRCRWIPAVENRQPLGRSTTASCARAVPAGTSSTSSKTARATTGGTP